MAEMVLLNFNYVVTIVAKIVLVDLAPQLVREAKERRLASIELCAGTLSQ